MGNIALKSLGRFAAVRCRSLRGLRFLLVAGTVVSCAAPATAQNASPNEEQNINMDMAQVLLIQSPAPQPATGSVTGRVMCSDTQRPARFAEVTLLPVPDATASNDDRFRAGGRRGSARTDLDGNYLMSNVQPGDYYLSATATGYVSNAATVFDRASASTSDAASLLQRLPQVHVSANGTAQGNVSLERGGVIAGRLLWDDGSAAAGVTVSAVSSTATNTLQQRGQNPLVQLGFGAGGQGGSAQSDDRGTFRLTGLAAGTYLVRATFSAPGPAAAVDPRFGGVRTVAITLYAPGKMRRPDAQVMTLASGEERDDVVFTADLRALHNVAGRVSSASDPAVHSGSVRLVDSQDTTLSRTAQLNADGSFTLPYVPAGTYTLSVPFSSSAVTQSGGGRRGGATTTTPATNFQPLTETLTVTDTDIAGVNLTVVPAAAATTTSATANR